jgi:protein ImuB
VELLDSLLFVLSPMLEQLLIRAQSRALALASVTVRLGLDGGGEHERTIKPALPVAQREVLLKLLHLDLQAHPPSAGVVSVFIQAEPGDRRKVQLGLFAPQLPEPMRLDVTLARIAALVGEDRVGRARLLDTHRPDSFVMERFTVTRSAAKAEGTSKQACALRRCRPARRLTMESRDARPVAFSLAGKRYNVREAYGPWRRSGEWWSSAVWTQEEWDVCATAGTDDALLCVLSHDLLRHEWQMDAVYD